jgi:fructokinase
VKKDSFYEVICFGETLWDVLPSGKMLGGAPMNVAYHLNRLGIPTALISRVGQDKWGDELLQFMRKRKIPTEFVQVDSEHSTGEVLAYVTKNQVTYDILKSLSHGISLNGTLTLRNC